MTREENQINQILNLLDEDVCTPERVPVVPDSKSQADDCFNNVTSYVNLNGGSAVNGWRISCYPKYVEAEFHCVWENEEGDLTDITPYNPKRTEILFAPIEKFIWDGTPVQTIILNTSRSVLVDDYIVANKAIFKMRMNRFLGKSVDKDQFKDAYELLQCTLKLLSHNGTIDSKCCCNSGKLFKNCHRYLVDKVKELA